LLTTSFVANLTLTPTQARRLAVTRQRLAGPRPTPTAAGIVNLVHDLGYVQIDPIGVVERTHRLVLFSRLGRYNVQHLNDLLFKERRLFEYWAHGASIVPTEDYPLHSPLMRTYPNGGGIYRQRAREWIVRNQKLRRYILNRLRREGPLLSRQLEEGGLHPEAWVSTGWTSGRNISRMLDFLWTGGKIMVAGRLGLQKLWDLSERVLPEWAPRDRLTEREVTRRAVERALRALGVGTARHIQYHFICGRYPYLPHILDELQREGRVQKVEIRDGRDSWPGEWYVHSDVVPRLDRVSDHGWEPRTVLLSPFDNLICDRLRTERLWDFDYRIEIYVPKPKRKYGYYVLPILHGEKLIGRLDPEMDRERGQLRVNGVWAEPGAPASAGRAVARALEDLAAFLGAKEILYNSRRIPAIWKRALQ
jgi:uncharacterized protein YcaQ